MNANPYSPSAVQRIHWFLHRLLTSPINRSTGFEVHGTSNPSMACSANVTIDGSYRRRYRAAFFEPYWDNCHAVFSMRSVVRAIRSRIAANSSSGRCVATEFFRWNTSSITSSIL